MADVIESWALVIFLGDIEAGVAYQIIDMLAIHLRLRLRGASALQPHHGRFICADIRWRHAETRAYFDASRLRCRPSD